MRLELFVGGLEDNNVHVNAESLQVDCLKTLSSKVDRQVMHLVNKNRWSNFIGKFIQ